MLLKLVEYITVLSDCRLQIDKGLIIFFYSYLIVGRIHYFAHLNACRCRQLLTCFSEFRSHEPRGLRLSSKRQVTGSKVICGLLWNTRRTIVSTRMREWGEAVLFQSLFFVIFVDISSFCLRVFFYFFFYYQTYDLQPATCDPQPATCNPRPATCDPRPATCDLQPATRDPRPAN